MCFIGCGILPSTKKYYKSSLMPKLLLCGVRESVTKIHTMTKEQLKEELVLGTKINIGKEYSKYYFFEEGEVILLEKGDDGIPSFYNESDDTFYSIYHFFGDNLENFLDCKVVV